MLKIHCFANDDEQALLLQFRRCGAVTREAIQRAVHRLAEQEAGDAPPEENVEHEE